jgi:hypothetical protein
MPPNLSKRMFLRGAAKEPGVGAPPLSPGPLNRFQYLPIAPGDLSAKSARKDADCQISIPSVATPL